MVCAYHCGRGSLWFRLAIREPRERVSWTSRWRDCSRTFIWSWLRVDIVGLRGCSGGWYELEFDEVKMLEAFGGSTLSLNYRNQALWPFLSSRFLGLLEAFNWL